jgi:16S rRNA (cytidine1402-2'-O)-methyltransferase
MHSSQQPLTTPGTLYVVATPIGNLEDISQRALRVLAEVTLIAAEDTRRTARLLERYGIRTPTVSYHEHNQRSRVPQLLRRLEDGESLALVTDAGTPGISDPGTELVDECLRHRIPVDPIPGASALVMVSGFPLTPLTWLGFSPHRAKDLDGWYRAIDAIPHAVCFLESPHRIEASLRVAATILGERQILVARELTKAHQELVRGTAGEVFPLLRSLKGEFTIVVGPRSIAPVTTGAASDAEILAQFGQMEESGTFGSKRQLVTALADRHGRPAREIYALVSKQRPSAE